MNTVREGSLEAPQRHSLDWRSADFNDESKLFDELERVFDICHGCRRCFSLCNAFPTLFDAIDDSESMELDTVDKEVYWDVVDHCYLCDLCFMTKCPYVPPHEWEVDFPHLMLRAKIVGHGKGRTRTRDRILSSTDAVGKMASSPLAFRAANSFNRNRAFRGVLENMLDVHKDAALPPYSSPKQRNALRRHEQLEKAPVAAGATTGRVAVFSTCYSRYNEPRLDQDLIEVLQHNDIPVKVVNDGQCCGMPKMEIGDMKSVERFKAHNVGILAPLARDGWDIIASIPSCTLMFRQELPVLFPDDEDVLAVRDSIYDPFEYLMLRHKHGCLKTEFKRSLGKVAYHVACHQRVQNVGAKTRDALGLVPETELTVIDRCSGHDGTYAVKRESFEHAVKIARPVASRVKQAQPDFLVSDCKLACNHIANVIGEDSPEPGHPISLLRHAYGI